MFDGSMDTILFHPLAPFVSIFGLFVLTLGFTSHNSPLRYLGFIPMLACTQLALRTAQVKNKNTHPTYIMLLMNGTCSIVLQYLDSVLLSRWCYEAQGPTSALGGQVNLRKPIDAQQHGKQAHGGTVVERLVFGCEEAFRFRSARTPWEVKHVPKFSPDDPDLVPSRARFVYWTSRRCLFSFLIVDAIGFFGRDTTSNAIRFASSRVAFFSRLQDVTTEELILRLATCVLNWVMFVYLLQTLYDSIAVVVIGLGLGHIERWPPLFNSWKECWSVRTFWGSFWHQCVRQRFLAPANFLAFSVLRMSKGTVVARYTVLTLTFTISGILHQFADVAIGVPWEEAGAVRFFIMQAIGIMIEDTVQSISRWLTGQKRTPVKPAGWNYGLGLAWVLIWLTWTTPVWTYPISQRSKGQGILPFSLLRWFLV